MGRRDYFFEYSKPWDAVSLKRVVLAFTYWPPGEEWCYARLIERIRLL